MHKSFGCQTSSSVNQWYSKRGTNIKHHLLSTVSKVMS
uniref:Uncharacterized protein n=1 Tax=Arundo donax TaxID=35708 RepID=A0A0A9AGN0_ARUDO